jgi:Flp pilus assembly protein TadG
MNRINHQRGAVAVLVAVMLILIFVCVALVVDMGHIHNVKVEMQKAVDAAALAGAQQLDGGTNQLLYAKNVAKATAFTNGVDLETEGPFITSECKGLDDKSCIGVWDKDALGSTAYARFTQTETSPNAVLVRANREVDHVFFFFLPSTDVTVDAIAVNVYEEKTIPLALVSCIPTGGKEAISSPGLSTCDIATYTFHGDTDDTGAWTSLTYNPASQDNILKFLDEKDGARMFNEVIYGTGQSHDGLEFTAVATTNRTIPVPDFPSYEDTVRGCVGNNGLAINCGLGPDPSLDPDDVDLIRMLDPGKMTSNPATDPLNYTPLPRWYHFDDNDSTYHIYNDAFTRLLTQDGILNKSSDELGLLYNGATSPFGADDYRFKASGSKEKFIKYDNSKKVYKPNYNEVLRYAGYPPVWVSNGTIPVALNKFLDSIISTLGKGEKIGEFKPAVSGEFEPFNTDNESHSGGAGETVRLTVPVIFAGNCDEWKALSVGPEKSDIKLYYVGTANFLVTRAWANSICYDHGDQALTITSTTPLDGSCNVSAPNFFDPEISSDLRFQCTSGKSPNAGLEGMIRVPTKGEKSDAGIRKIYLVE